MITKVWETGEEGRKKNERAYRGLSKICLWVWGMVLVFCSWSAFQNIINKRLEKRKIGKRK